MQSVATFERVAFIGKRIKPIDELSLYNLAYEINGFIRKNVETLIDVDVKLHDNFAFATIRYIPITKDSLPDYVIGQCCK